MTFFNSRRRREKTTMLDQELAETLGSNHPVCICNRFKKANLKLIVQLCSSQGIWTKFTGAGLIRGAQILLKLTFKDRFLLNISV